MRTTATGANSAALGQMQHGHSQGSEWSYSTMSHGSIPSSDSQDSPLTNPCPVPESSKALWLPRRHYLSQDKAQQPLLIRDDFSFCRKAEGRGW